jgi:hypothetical protein
MPFLEYIIIFDVVAKAGGLCHLLRLLTVFQPPEDDGLHIREVCSRRVYKVVEYPAQSLLLGVLDGRVLMAVKEQPVQFAGTYFNTLILFSFSSSLRRWRGKKIRDDLSELLSEEAVNSVDHFGEVLGDVCVGFTYSMHMR